MIFTFVCSCVIITFDSFGIDFEFVAKLMFENLLMPSLIHCSCLSEAFCVVMIFTFAKFALLYCVLVCDHWFLNYRYLFKINSRIHFGGVVKASAC